MLAAENVYTLSGPRPQTEQFRLAALHRYGILDTPACADFNFLTDLAAQLCNVPYACIALVDAERVWFKACTGMVLAELPREHSVFSLAVLGDASTEIPDLTQDGRTAGMALAVPAMRLFSGAALTSADGHAIGTLCVMNTEPGRLSAPQRATLAGLARQVMALIERRSDAQTLANVQRELEQLATTDALTGLHNRRSLLQRLKFEAARAKRFRSPLSALMIALDDYQSLQDEHGHAVAEQVLASVGRLLRDSVRVIDLPGRYGGELVCVVLPNTPVEGAGKLAETLRLKIAAQLHQVGSQTLTVTASVGVGAFDHLHIDDAEGLLRQAELALRQ